MKQLPATKGGELKRQLEDKTKYANKSIGIKVVERPGEKFIQEIQKVIKKPKRNPCEDCLICRTEKG